MRPSGQHAERDDRRTLDLPAIEREVAARWSEIDLVGRSLDQARSAAGPVWSCYTQPSPTSGVPDLGYARTRTISDLYARFKTMQGMKVPRDHGWACHGLAVEVAVTCELGLSDTRPSENGISVVGGVEGYGVGRFAGRCRESAIRHAEAFASAAERMGCLTDPGQFFRTMDPRYVETVWWSVQQFFDAGLLVKDYRIGRYCPRCRTPLAEHETRGRGAFRKAAGTAAIVRLRVDRLPDGACPRLAGADLLARTTTPWMLAANTGLAVHPQDPYVIARRAGHDDKVVLADARFARVLGDGWHVVATIGGSELAGVTYRPPFQVPGASYGRVCLVMADRAVRTDAGTGIVPLAAAYGVGPLPPAPGEAVDPIGADGCFRSELRSLAGRFFADADPAVVDDLSERGMLFAAAPHRWARPHCWRCGTPLLTRAASLWVITTSAILDRLREQAEHVVWVPDPRDRRPAGLATDWVVGRTRFWGVPLPIWECERGHLTCVGSLAELSERAGRDLIGIDPHRPAVDGIVIRCRDCGSEAHRTPETLDASYDGGVMPFAQDQYPAMLAVAGGADASTWCDAMMVVGGVCAGRVPFRAVISPGRLIDERGRPMTGLRGNLAEPTALIERHGADALRWYFAAQTPRRAASKVADADVRRLGRQVLGGYLGSVRFFLDQAGPGRSVPDFAVPPSMGSVLDRWLLSETHSAVSEVTAALEMFRSDVAAGRVRQLIGGLAGWYVPLARRRLADGPASSQGIVALPVLRHCLEVLTRLMAPFGPFASDYGWNLIRSADAPASVHLATWPAPLTTLVDERLNEQMTQVRAIVGVGKAARATASVPGWQPLAAARLFCAGADSFTPELLELIAEELNVRAVEAAGTAAPGPASLRPETEWLVVGQRAGTVGLDLAITPELRREGLARRAVRAGD